MNNAAVDMDMQIPLQGPTISSLDIYSELAESCGFPDGSVGKESACNAGDMGLIPGLGRSLGEGNSYLLQYSGLKNSMDRGAWGVTVHGVTESQTQLNDLHTLEVLFLIFCETYIVFSTAPFYFLTNST